MEYPLASIAMRNHYSVVFSITKIGFVFLIARCLMITVLVSFTLDEGVITEEYGMYSRLMGDMEVVDDHSISCLNFIFLWELDAEVDACFSSFLCVVVSERHAAAGVVGDTTGL